MSSLFSPARSRATRPIGTLPRPRLTVVPRLAARVPRVPFVLLVVTLLASGLVGLLLLNTSLQRGAYQATELRREATDLAARQQALEIQLAALQEPQRLLEQSIRLGMVENDSPAFISLATGTIIGKPVPAEASDRVEINYTNTATSAASTKVVQPLAGTGASLSSGAITVGRPDRQAVGEQPGDGDQSAPRGDRR